MKRAAHENNGDDVVETSSPNKLTSSFASLTAAILFAAFAVCFADSVVVGAEFYVLGERQGWPKMVSPDGSAVLTGDFSSGKYGIWMRGNGWQELDHSGYAWSSVRDISDDGNVAVAEGNEGNELQLPESGPLVWASDAGISRLPLPAEHANDSSSGAWAVSGNGQVIAGYTNESPFRGSLAFDELFRWSQAEGSVVLESPFGGIAHGQVTDVSYDGSLLVGTDITQVDGSDAAFPVAWTKEGATVLTSSGGMETGYAEAVTSDGSVIVGNFSRPTGKCVTEPFRWTEAEGGVELGCFPGTDETFAHDVSADGQVIVGRANRFGGYAAVWDPGHAWRDLEKVVHDEHGVSEFQLKSRPGYNFGEAVSISDDKRAIAGVYVTTGGATQPGWIVYLDEPIDSWSANAGDFNGNGTRDVEDIDLLSAELRASSPDLSFDLFEDRLINDRDRVSWVKYASQTWFGDANLDGQFSSADLVQVFQAGRYETGATAGWAQGDWDGDGLFTTADFTLAFQDGGYEQGLRAAAHPVPEPSTVVLIAFPALIGCSRIRTKQHQGSNV